MLLPPMLLVALAPRSRLSKHILTCCRAGVFLGSSHSSLRLSLSGISWVFPCRPHSCSSRACALLCPSVVAFSLLVLFVIYAAASLFFCLRWLLPLFCLWPCFCVLASAPLHSPRCGNSSATAEVVEVPRVFGGRCMSGRDRCCRRRRAELVFWSGGGS